VAVWPPYYPCAMTAVALSPFFSPINTNIKRGEGGGNREKDLKTEGDVCSRTKGRRTKKQKGRKTVTNRGGEKKNRDRCLWIDKKQNHTAATGPLSHYHSNTTTPLSMPIPPRLLPPKETEEEETEIGRRRNTKKNRKEKRRRNVVWNALPVVPFFLFVVIAAPPRSHCKEGRTLLIGGTKNSERK